MGCSPSTTIEADVLSKSILRKIVANPEDWKDFLEIFVVESFSLLNKNVTVAEKAFIVVVSGEITAFLSNRGASTQSVAAKVYRSPDLIHVVRTKSAVGGENGNGDRDNKLSYGDLSISFKATASEGNASVVSFDLADVEEFVSKRPHLVMLSKLLKLQFSDVLGGNLEFSSWSSDEINMLLPLTQLRLTSLGDILSRTVEKSAAADSVESGTVYAENLLKADCSAGILIEGTFILIDDDSSADDFWETYRKAVMAKKPSPSRAKRNSLWSATPLLSAIPESKRENKVYADADVQYNFEEQGILLELGSTYGLEQILLKDPMALDTIVCCDDGLVATLGPDVISACKLVAQQVVTRLQKIFNSAVIESVMDCVPLFNSLNERDLDTLESEVEIFTLPAGSTLHKQDDPSTHIYIVVRGSLEELIYSKQNVSNDLSFNIGEIYETGACLGELSVISEAPFPNTMTCIVPCVIMAINAATYKAVFRNVDQNQCEEKIREGGTAVAMEYVLMHPDAYKSFCGFLKIEMSAENIQFWHAVAQFEELCTVMSGLDKSAKDGGSRSESPSYSPSKARRGSVQSSSIQRMSSTISRDSTIRMQANAMSKVKDMACLIMAQYVSEGAVEQVNIPGPMRKETEASYKAWLESLRGSEEFDPLTIFAKAKREVFTLMKKDSFPRWKDTPEFLQLVEKLRQTSSGDGKQSIQPKRRKTTKK